MCPQAFIENKIPIIILMVAAVYKKLNLNDSPSTQVHGGGGGVPERGDRLRWRPSRPLFLHLSVARRERFLECRWGRGRGAVVAMNSCGHQLVCMVTLQSCKDIQTQVSLVCEEVLQSDIYRASAGFVWTSC